MINRFSLLPRQRPLSAPRVATAVALFAGLAVASIAFLPALAATSGANGSHDPSRMIECEGKVYVYSTQGNAKSSPDGLVWTDIQSPPWSRSLANNQGVWAPDGIFLNGQYYLYSSQWSSAKASRITLLTSASLNPSSPNYKWTDQGTVVDGPAGVTHSVIDPAPFLDAQGNLWIVWGGGYPFSSSADSVFVTRLDNKTGLPLMSDPGYKPPNSPGYAIEQGHKEGTYIYYHSGNYYLFYQTGSCCEGASSSYTIHVARSTNVNSGYGGDKTFFSGKSGLHGPGHIGIYSACGYERFTYHYYPDSGNSVIGENELVWGADGWPTVGAESTTPMKLCGSSGAGGASGGGSGGVSGSGGMTGIPDAGVTGSGGRSGGDAGVTGGAPGSGGTSATGGVSGGTGGAATGGSTTTAASGGSAMASGGSSSMGGAVGSGGSVGSGGAGITSDSTSGGCACDVRGGRGLNDAHGLWLLGVALALTASRRRRRVEDHRS